MRKPFMVLLACSLLTSAFVAPSAEAKKKKKKKRVERKVEATYQAPAAGSGPTGGLCSPGNFGCVVFPLARGEQFAKVEIEDSTGTDIYATLGQDTDDNPMTIETVGSFCGSTGEEPLAIRPGLEVYVSVYTGPGTDPPCAGVASSGSVKATFSNLP